MITHFKIFENVSKYEKGDFIYVDLDNFLVRLTKVGFSVFHKRMIIDFLRNNIGVFQNISTLFNTMIDDPYCSVKFDDIPKELDGKVFSNKGIISLKLEEIKYSDKTKEGIKQKIKSNEFNL